MREFVFEQSRQLLGKLGQQVELAAAAQDADTIHDLRVSIRRFSQALLLFPDFFPAAECRKIRKHLKQMMRLTSQVRNRDIAQEFLEGGSRTELMATLQRDRSKHASAVVGEIEEWKQHEYLAGWKSVLALNQVATNHDHVGTR